MRIDLLIGRGAVTLTKRDRIQHSTMPVAVLNVMESFKYTCPQFPIDLEISVSSLIEHVGRARHSGHKSCDQKKTRIGDQVP